MSKVSSYGIKVIRTDTYVFVAVIFLTIYLILGSGLHGDDYAVISGAQKVSFYEYFYPSPDKIGASIFNLPNYYLFRWTYFTLGYDYQIIYDLIKVFSISLSVYLTYRFFTDYLQKDRAFILSILFCLYPLHDTTSYWYMTFTYVLIPSLILFSHHIIRNNKYKIGAPILLISSFAHYSSPPYVFGLAVIFIFEKKFKKAAIFAIPGFLYVAYYFWIKFNYAGVERRINTDLSILDFLKKILLQPISFIESALGPSYWLKAFYAIESISLVSMIIVAVISVFAFLKVKKISKIPLLSKSLLAGLVSVLILSFGMYALTGLYSHSAFNLGNRSTVYGSLFIAFLLVTFLPANKKSLVFLLIIFLAPVLGLSDHWKSWNSHQKIVIENIKNNQKLKEIETNSTLIVTGNIYSKLGPFAHIEFFSMPWNVSTIFKDSVRTKNIVALTPYVVINDDYLIDPKFRGKYFLKDKLYVYDSEKDLVKAISAKDVPELIKHQPIIVRHWVQLFKDTWVQNIVVWLSPRLVYLFE